LAEGAGGDEREMGVGNRRRFWDDIRPACRSSDRARFSGMNDELMEQYKRCVMCDAVGGGVGECEAVVLIWVPAGSNANPAGIGADRLNTKCQFNAIF
jgi:hypothetical protein